METSRANHTNVAHCIPYRKVRNKKSENIISFACFFSKHRLNTIRGKSLTMGVAYISHREAN